jgi:hypothetical protein
MQKKIEGKNIFYILKFRALYLFIQIKMALMSCLLVRVKVFKSVIPFLLSLLLFLAFPGLFWAQEVQWPWVFEGENFEITNWGDNFSPSIASNDHLYLAVWYKGSSSSGFDIYGARITKDGQVLDPDGFLVCTATQDQMFPVTAWDGENFFVVWQDKRTGNRWDIYGARVTPEGQVLDSEGILVAKGKFYDQVSPNLSFDGENYLVIWRGKKSSSAYSIYFKRVSKNGEVLDVNPIPINPSTRDQASPSIAFNGENYLVVWQDFRNGKYWDTYGSRVTPSGEVLDAKAIPISLQSKEYGWNQYRPVVSWDGNFFLVIWVASIDKEWYLEGKRVNGNGGIADILDITIERENNTNKTNPALRWDGDQYLLVWEEEPEGESKIYGTSIAPQYKPFEMSETIQFSSPQVQKPSHPGISTIGDNALVFWQGKGRDDYWQIFGQRLKKQFKVTSDSKEFIGR